METRHTTQGIIVRAVPYQDYHRIITLFTPDKGLLSLFVKGAFKKGSGSSSTPLATVEVTYQEKTSGLHSCQEIDPLDMRLAIRQNLPTLEAACHMLRTVQQSQAPEKPAPLLYQLLLFYLGKLPHTPCPPVLSTSFLLKTLRHEGLLTFPFTLPPNISFDETEHALTTVLALCDTHSQLIPLEVSPAYQNKIERLFAHLLG